MRRNSFQLISKIFLGVVLTGFSWSGHAIRGGFSALGSEWSSVVGIQDCSGVMVHERILLTAAHCLANRDLRRRGIVIQPDSRYPSAGVNLEVNDFQLHPDWRDIPGKVTSHDLAYVILKDPLPWPVAIYPWVEGLLPPPESRVIALGLGPDRSLRIGSRGEDRYLRSLRRGFELALVQDLGALQVYFPNVEGESACHSDSGGAVFTETQDGQRRLLGLLIGISDICEVRGQSQFVQPLKVDAKFWQAMWEKVK